MCTRRCTPAEDFSLLYGLKVTDLRDLFDGVVDSWRCWGESNAGSAMLDEVFVGEEDG